MGLPANFNDDPFELGAYDDIAQFHGGKGKRVTRFAIEATFEGSTPKLFPVTMKTTFRAEAGQPLASEQVLTFRGLSLTWSKGDATGTTRFRIETPTGSESLQLPIQWQGFFPVIFPLSGVRQLVTSEKSKLTQEDWKSLDEVIDLPRLLRAIGRPSAFAPIRTRPRRTYDPLQSSPSPEGGHVPPTLARLHAAREGDWELLDQELSDFGKASGMFEKVDVRHLGKEESDPFKILVRVQGQRYAPPLIDVGYGVSQVLPILVDIVRGKRLFLLQQPEVHLHPRAQAALGTFLGRLVTKGHRLLVETHSDHLLSRVRREVRREGNEQNPSPSDVVIAYLERSESEVRVHPIQVDQDGNLQGAPSSYREFFINEELSMIGADVPDS